MQETWFWDLAPNMTCVTSGKLLHISDFQFLICEIKKIILIKIKCIEYLALSLVPSQPKTNVKF